MSRLKLTLLALLALLAAPAGFGAGAGDLRRDQPAPSPALGAPLLYSVYVPEAAPGERLPVVYLLHGYGGGQYEWAQGGRIEAKLDRLIDKGEIEPVIAVMPAAGKSWYVDSARWGGPGDYETAIVRDLVAHVDATYSTIASRQGRAIMGLSMGGHGALRLAFAHPEVFGAVAGLSPAIWRPGGVSARSGPGAVDLDARERWYPRTTGETFDLATFNLQSPFALVTSVAAADPPPAIMLAVGDDDFFGLHDGTV
ncbi:MAG: alpha/beta hydrolase-fold protein [Pseudomonadota bacterium]